MDDFGAILSQVRPWLTSGAIVALLTMWFRERRENRKLDGAEIEALRDENRDLRADMAAMRRENNEYRRACQEETDQLRTLVNTLRGEVAALQLARLTETGAPDAKMATSLRRLK